MDLLIARVCHGLREEVSVLRNIWSIPFYVRIRHAVVQLHLYVLLRVIGSFQMVPHTQDPLDLLQKILTKLRPVVGYTVRGIPFVNDQRRVNDLEI